MFTAIRPTAQICQTLHRCGIEPSGQRGTRFFFDDGDSNMEKQEVRVYDGKVECASCHDPHGVPSGGAGSTFKPTFLRVANTGSALCLTCHTK